MKFVECECGGKAYLVEFGLVRCEDCCEEYEVEMVDDPENEGEFEKDFYYGSKEE